MDYEWDKNFLELDMPGDLTDADGNIVLAPSTQYYVYISDLGQKIFSTVRPYDRHFDLFGKYHRWSPWRAIGAVSTDGSSNLLSSSLFNYYDHPPITSQEIGAGQITFSNLGQPSIGAVNIFPASISDSLIVPGGITGVSIANGSIPQVKLGTNPLVRSGSCGSFTATAPQSLIVIPPLSLSISTTGNRVVVIKLSPDQISLDSYIRGAVVSGGGNLVLHRDGSPIATWSIIPDTGVSSFGYPVSSILFEDQPAGGAHTYDLRVVMTGTGHIDVFDARLVAYET
jgi:hypothetical protein